MNRACDRPCKAICGFSSPTRLLTLHAGSFVRCLRRFRGGEFLEARIIPKRIEHPHRPSVVLLISHKIILLIAHIRANIQRSDVRMGFQERKYEPQETRRRFQRGAFAFLDSRRIVLADASHSGSEQRLFCIGRTPRGILTVRYAHRGERIRIIGAGILEERQTNL
jgi:uncharacterized DUF497 family protein